jgi:hypothetical protein
MPRVNDAAVPQVRSWPPNPHLAMQCADLVTCGPVADTEAPVTTTSRPDRLVIGGEAGAMRDGVLQLVPLPSTHRLGEVDRRPVEYCRKLVMGPSPVTRDSG